MSSMTECLGLELWYQYQSSITFCPRSLPVKRKSISPFFPHQNLMVRNDAIGSTKRNTSVESIRWSLKNGCQPLFANCRSRYIPEICVVSAPQGKANRNHTTWLHITNLAA